MNDQHTQQQGGGIDVRGKRVYINFYGPIEFGIVQGFMHLCNNLRSHGATSLYFLFASPGGDITAGIQMYNFLKCLPIEICMHNMSSIDSIATVIFLAGDLRYACPNSTFLFHGAKTTFLRESSHDLRRLNEICSGLEKDEEKIMGIITENTKISEDEMKEFFVSGQSTNLEFAKNKEFIHGIALPTFENDASFINVDISPVVGGGKT